MIPSQPKSRPASPRCRPTPSPPSGCFAASGQPDRLPPPHVVLELAERLAPAGGWDRIVPSSWWPITRVPCVPSPRAGSASGQGMSTWEEVDTFSCYLAGPAWREGRVDAVVGLVPLRRSLVAAGGARLHHGAQHSGPGGRVTRAPHAGDLSAAARRSRRHGGEGTVLGAPRPGAAGSEGREAVRGEARGFAGAEGQAGVTTKLTPAEDGRSRES